jgi:hypothetical protein
MIVDECSFQVKTEYALIWLEPDEEIPESQRHRVQSGNGLLAMG